jgi:hypothetical protein
MRSVRSAMVLVLGMVVCGVSFADSPTVTSRGAMSSTAVETQAALRDVWLGHIFWVREVVNAKVAKNSQATKVAENRAVQNAKQIAGAIEPFYGKAASDQLFELLAGHYGAIQAHADATLAGQPEQAKQASIQLTENARQISQFLSSANPNLSRQALDSLLTAHGAHHLQQNQQLAKGDRAGEAQTWDAMRIHIYAISDALTQAIAKQFPEKFR